MTIVHAVAVVEAVFIALLPALLLRRRGAQQAADEGGPYLASAAGSSAAPRYGIRGMLRDRWKPLGGRFAMLPVGRLRRIGARNGRGDRTAQGREALYGMPSPMPLDDQFRDTLERLPLAILIANADGRIELVNAVTEKLFGYARAEMIGLAADMLVPGMSGADAGRGVLTNGGPSAPAAEPPSVMLPLFARRKDGSRFLADVALNVISSEHTRLKLAVVIDRTDRYELQRNRQELAHLTRVSALGELAASLAHELNQPLTAILSNVQAAQRFMMSDPINLDEVREILQDLVEDNNRASEILRRIRALVKKGELELVPLSLASVIGDVALLVHSDAIVRAVRVSLDVDPGLPLVRGDKVQLQQVVLNLLLNAFDAMEGGTGQDREVAVSASLEPAGMVRIAVRDRGPGLTSDRLEQIFKPFYTSKRDGLGLGLSISRSIVEMHGGRIWAENNADCGATFHFTLPTGDAAATGRSTTST
ncbi:Signal transduction histidine kinase [Caballeronia glathei]|jgi:two-component system sensor kinase FixL|uniref:histidine kinase n=1 Tax=Caballeronia glathei TaxID=60547 RepID=A0A069PPD2_9BURK|nr:MULTISPECIES: PAS domain-containing sensor histidine kinase [Burkholderiaceae]KDR42302.1 histidine kinase [Caballeronia glathei]TCK38954.1 two-component system sensor kinase FixL [Paraburkholderia sp. BL8N3]CDY76340.1 Signal transduction histidine kinase [Caballeronia glathei]